MDKLSNKQYEKYWKGVHNKALEDELCYVCFPDKPKYFNLFFDRIEKYIIKKYLRKEKVSLKGKKLLDLGCGRGRWLRFFKTYGAKVTGIDLSEEAAAYCIGSGSEACAGSITDMKMFANGQFDVVTSITVLLHLPYDLKEEAIREISRVIKSGGKIILIENTWDDPSPHVYGFKIDKWEALFHKYGMKMVHQSAHCFNFCRRKFPCYIKWVETIAIYLDYIFDYAFMWILYGKRSDLGLQHLMVFEKE